MSQTESVGSFRILEPLGKGGMGEVFLAEDTRLGRRVALKFLPPELQSTDSAREGLIQEARLASALNHPHICIIHDIGIEPERTYIVMEHVEGKTLKQQLKTGPLPVETVVKYGAQLAEALSYAHDKGVIHRDLKSANVMVNAEGRIKILDFGLALQISTLNDEDQPTVAYSGPESSLAGTVHYMAPELLKGQPADKRSDVWALGVILFEAVSGRLPFVGKSVFELTAAILKQPPEELDPSVPPGLASVIHKCMAKKPESRYLQTGEVHASLEILATTMATGGLDALTRTSIGFLDLTALPASADTQTLGGAVGWVAREIETARTQSIAVLPLKNLSHKKDEDYFADCMTESLITDLAKIRALKVISYGSAMRYKNSEQSIPEIAAALDVKAIIEGSVLRIGEQVRVSAQLVDAASDTHLWAESYMRNFTDIFALQSEVAQAIASEVHVQLTPQEGLNLAHRSKVDPDAHEALLKGLHVMAKPERLGEAIGWFKKSISLDPTYSRPYTSLAQSHLLLAMYGFARPLDVFPLANANAQKAIALDETSGEAHCILAWTIQLYQFNRAACEREYRRSLELNPGAEETLRLCGCYLMGTGRADEGLKMLRKSVDLAPQAAMSNVIYAYGLHVARQYSQALEHCELVIESHPRFWWAHWVKGEVLTAKGLYDEAMDEYEHAIAASRNSFTIGSLGAAYGLSGQTEKAEQFLADLEKQGKTSYVSPYFIAVIHLGLGRNHVAVDWLERAWQERDGWVQWLLVNPTVDRVRSNPRYEELLKRIGLR